MVQKLKEHESVNRQTRRRLEETGEIAVICAARRDCAPLFRVQYRHIYTRACARDIAVPRERVNEILGSSYCNVSRRLLKRGEGWGDGSIFLSATSGRGAEEGERAGEFRRGSPIETTLPTGEVIGCVSS